MYQKRFRSQVLGCALLMFATSSFRAVDLETAGSRPRAFVNLACNPYKYWDPDLKAAITSNCTTPDELDKIARYYARALRLRFEFGTAEPHVLILRSTNCLACVWYAADKGQPALLCTFNFDRKILGHTVGIASRSGAEIPKIVFGVESVNLDSGISGAATNLITPESLLSLVKQLVKDQDVQVDFSRQQTGIAVHPEHRSLNVFTDFGNYRSDILCQVDFDWHVTVTGISPVMRSMGLDLTSDGKLKKTK